MCGCGLSKETEWWWLQVDSTEIFSFPKGDLLSDISGIVSHWRDLLTDMSQKCDLLSDCQKCYFDHHNVFLKV